MGIRSDVLSNGLAVALLEACPEFKVGFVRSNSGLDA